MLWIIITIVVTIAILKFGRRFTWSPVHIFRLEAYDWLDDVIYWFVINNDWSQFNRLIKESIQEQFRSRAPTGWTLKLEGPPTCPGLPIDTSNQGTIHPLKEQSPTHTTTHPSTHTATHTTTHTATQPSTQSRDNIEVDLTTSKASSNVSRMKKEINISNILSSSLYPISMKRVQTISKSSREMICAVDIKLSNISQDAFITSRQINQLESSKCKLELVNLTGQMKFRLLNHPNESTIDISMCFSGTPKININIPRSSFQKEETLLALNSLLKESISNFGLKFPIFKKTKIQQNNFEVISSNLNQSTLQSEIPQVIKPPNTLNIKILKANSLYDRGSHDVYCLVSVDSPSQSQKTSSVADSPNPFFDELLTFQLDDSTKKLSFVMHDKSSFEEPLGRADLLVKEVSSDGITNRPTRVVLPLMSKLPTSHMSLTAEISSATVDSNAHNSPPKHELNGKTDVYKTPQHQTLPPNPSIRVESSPQILPKIAAKSSDHPHPPSGLWKNNGQTDSNLSLVSQASLMVRNNSNESKGRKHKSLLDAMRRKFRGKRSKSAEPVNQSPDGTTGGNTGDKKVFSDGMYLTPPPKRLQVPGSVEHWSLSSSTPNTSEATPQKKRGKMSSFKNLFRKKAQNSTAP